MGEFEQTIGLLVALMGVIAGMVIIFKGPAFVLKKTWEIFLNILEWVLMLPVKFLRGIAPGSPPKKKKKKK